MRTLSALALTLLALTLPAFLALAREKKDAPTEKKDSSTEKKDSSSEADSKYPEKVAGKTLDDWIKELHSHDPGVREHAVRTMLDFGPASAKAALDVVHMADQDRDVSPRVNAIIVLMLMEIRDRDVPAAVAALKRKATDDQQAVVRLHAALALGRFEEMAASAIPNLVNASRDNSSWEIRKAAIGSLGKVGVDKKKKKTPPDPRATRAILHALRTSGYPESSAKVRLEAVMALGAMGPSADPVLKRAVTQALAGRLRDRDKTVAIWSHVALMALENKVTEPYLKGIADFLTHRDVETRKQAARALGQLGGFADKDYVKLIKAHVPDLLSAVKDSDPGVVGMACWALGQLGRKIDPGEDVMTALTKLSKRPKIDATVKYMVLAALESIKGRKDIQELGAIKKELDKEKEKNKKPVLP